MSGNVSGTISHVSRLDTDTSLTKKSESNLPTRIYPQNEFEKFTNSEIEQTVAQRFEKQVVQYSDRLAVQDRSRSLTYREFNALANHIAHGILAVRGEGNEQVVLFFEQGINFLAGIFGVLKTGKCYVPIDPSFPKERNRYILENSQACLIVTNSANWETAEHLAGGYCPLLNIDTLESDLSKENPSLNFSPDALAYIIYTSGSTGKPKGVFQNNRNLLHNAMNQINAFHLGKGDRMPLVHSCSVMGAVRVIYNALLSGTTLYPFDVKAEGLNALRSLLIEEKITVFHSVATLFRHFAEIFRNVDAFPHLRLVILGGEAMTRKDVEFYQQYFPHRCLLCTGLGSTETGTVRVLMLDKNVEISTALVPPGYAVEGVEVLLWDEEGNNVPLGEVGEIVVQSKYLAVGYWQPDETNAQTFAPVSSDSPVRSFRTGDLGKLLPDECLVHLGRKDFQVKVRGYRVNVAEVEAALMDYGFFKEVVVMGRELEPERSPGETSLVAYLVPREASVDINEIRHFLKQKLPEYMMPSAYVNLEKLPVTANGKIDRRALPTPDLEKQLERNFVVSTNHIEQQLIAIWEKVLGIPQPIGIKDNFFELGGNSLVGVRLLAEIENLFGIKLQLTTLFQAQTIEELAADLTTDNTQVTESYSSLVKIKSGGSNPPLFCVHHMGGSVLEYYQLAKYLGEEQPVYALQSIGLDGKYKPLTTLEEMASQYIQDMKSIQPQGPYFIVGYSFGGKVAFEIARQIHELGEEVKLLAIIDTVAPRLRETGDRENAPPLDEPRRNHSRLAKFLSLNPHERIDYIRNGLRIHRTFGKLRIPYQFYLRYIKRSLPEAGSLDVYWKNTRAFTHYVAPSTYPGRVTLFYSDEKLQKLAVTPALNWDKLATGGVELHFIPGCNHAAIVQVPYVNLLGKELTSALDRL